MYGVTPGKVRRKSPRRRTDHVAWARFVCYHILYGMGYTTNMIGEYYSIGQDMVAYGINRVRDRIKSDLVFARFLVGVKFRLQSSPNGEDFTCNKVAVG